MTTKDLIEGIAINFPDTIVVLMFALILFGFKEKTKPSLVITYSLLQTAVDVLSGIVLKNIGLIGFHFLPYGISSALLIWFLFKIDILPALISVILAMMLDLVVQLVSFLGMAAAIGISDNLINVLENNLTLKILLNLGYLAISTIIIYFASNRSFTIFDLKKHSFFSKFSLEGKHEFNENIKIAAIALTPIIIFIAVNFSIFYYRSFNRLSGASLPYLIVNSLGLLVSSILIVILIRKIIKLKHYKIEWSTQQKYLDNINELLKGLRAQKHGFINHMNVIYGFLTLKEYDNAMEYLSNIHEAISTKENVITVNNPTLNALLNAKLKIAENREIKFEVSIESDLSHMSFKAFEIGEAIGNIIDNAFDAVKHLNPKQRIVKFRIHSDDKYYFFESENNGKTIPESILKRMFEEGFTTKTDNSDEHGLGLYIAKNIVEYYQGKINVISRDNKTTFTVFIPKVVQNEFQAS